MSTQDRQPTNSNRRTWLKVLGGIGLTSSLAGCFGDDDDGDGGDDDDSGDGLSSFEDTLNFVYGRSQSQTPDAYEMGTRIAQNWREIGVDVEFQGLNSPQPSNQVRYEDRDYDILYMGMAGAANRLDPSFYLREAIHSRNADESGSINFMGSQNEEIDDLADEQHGIYDQDERQDLAYQMQELCFEEVVWGMFLHQSESYVYNTDTCNIPEDAVVPSVRVSLEKSTIIEMESFRDDGSLHVSRLADDVDVLNPFQINRVDHQIENEALYDTLTYISPEHSAENWLATEVRSVDDTTLEIDIRDGHSFHDGEPVTPDDVAYSFNAHQEHQTPFISSFLTNMESATVDGDTVVVELSEPDAPFTYVTTSLMPIVPEHIFGEMDNPAEGDNIPPIGSGPFQFDSYEPGSVMRLTAVDDHFNAPEADSYNLQMYGSAEAAVRAALDGEVDFMADVGPELFETVEDADNAERVTVETNNTNAICHNVRRGLPMADRAFRQALQHCIPREQAVDEIWQGAAQVGGSMIAPSNDFWTNPDIEPRELDLEQARSILEDAGYDWDDDGNLLYPTDVPEERLASAPPLD